LAPEVCTITSELKNRFKAGNKRVEGELYWLLGTNIDS